MRARVQSCNAPTFAAQTRLARARAKARFESDFRGVTASCLLSFSASSAASSTTCTITSPQGLGSLTKHVWQTSHVLHHTRTDCLHTVHSMPLRKVNKSWLPPCGVGPPSDSATVSWDGACRSACLRVGPWQARGNSHPPQKMEKGHHHLPLRAPPLGTTAWPLPQMHVDQCAAKPYAGDAHQSVHMLPACRLPRNPAPSPTAAKVADYNAKRSTC